MLRTEGTLPLSGVSAGCRPAVLSLPPAVKRERYSLFACSELLTALNSTPWQIFGEQVACMLSMASLHFSQHLKLQNSRIICDCMMNVLERSTCVTEIVLDGRKRQALPVKALTVYLVVYYNVDRLLHIPVLGGREYLAEGPPMSFNRK